MGIFDFLGDAVSWVGDHVGDILGTIFLGPGYITWDLLSSTDNIIGQQFSGVQTWVGQQMTQLRDWAVEQIIALTNWIKLMKYRFRNALAEWMKSPLGFWLTIVGVAALVYYMPQIIEYIKSTKVYLFLTNVYEVLKKTTGTLLDKLHYIQALEIHRIMLILDPNYQDFWGKMDEAFCGMAEEIELGVGTLNILSYNIRELYYSTYVMYGLDPDSIELKYYDDITNFWSNARQRWEKYVVSPQSIFTDIMHELVFPVLNEKAAAGQEQAKETIRQANAIDKTITNIDNVRIALDNLVYDLPTEIRDSVLANIGPQLDYINKTFDEIVLPNQIKLEESIAVIDETTRGIDDALYNNAIRKRTFGDEFVSILFDGTLDIDAKRRMMSEIVSRMLQPEVSHAEDILTLSIASSTRNDSNSPPLPEEKIPEGEVSLFTFSLEKAKALVEPWFVGEY